MAGTIIKDFLAGMIILSENKSTFSDLVTVGLVSGAVEKKITLRAAILLDSEGKRILITNGDICSVSI